MSPQLKIVKIFFENHRLNSNQKLLLNYYLNSIITELYNLHSNFKPKIVRFFKCGMIPTHKCICILVLITLKMGVRVVETWLLLCNEITFVHPSAFVGNLKKNRISN